MTNIYKLIQEVKKIQESPLITSQEKIFLNTLITGKKDHWRPLAEFAMSPTQSEMKKIIKVLKDEINNVYYLDLKNLTTHFTYKKLLNKCLESFESMLLKINYLSVMESKNTKQYKKGIEKLNQLYRETTELYHGTIMLPVMQGLDPRLGNSGGECLGYTIQWAMHLLQNKNPFGINMDQPPPFKVIPFDSNVIKKYPHLNHLAKLNDDIAKYQQIKKAAEIKTSLNMPSFFLETATLSNKLLKYTNQDSSKIYKITLMGGKLGFAGHAMGFCKKNNKFHFFDSNGMWVSFDKADSFQSWLTFYFKMKGYDTFFHEYSINSFELKPLQEKKDQPLSLGGKILLSPFLLVGGTLAILYIGVTRPFIYSLFHLKQGGESILKYFSDEIAQSKSIEHTNMTTTKDDADNFQKKPKIKFINSTYTMAEKMDVNPEELRQAKLKLLDNDNKVLPLKFKMHHFIEKKQESSTGFRFLKTFSVSENEDNDNKFKSVISQPS